MIPFGSSTVWNSDSRHWFFKYFFKFFVVEIWSDYFYPEETINEFSNSFPLQKNINIEKLKKRKLK